MSESHSNEGFGERVSLPWGLESSALDDGIVGECARLWQRLATLRRELEEERAQRIAAEDRAWLRVVDALGDRSALLADLWSAQEIEFVDATGAHLDALRTGDFETLGSDGTPVEWREAIVLETWRPAVRRGGRTIRPGQVVVGRGTRGRKGRK